MTFLGQPIDKLQLVFYPWKSSEAFLNIPGGLFLSFCSCVISFGCAGGFSVKPKVPRAECTYFIRSSVQNMCIYQASHLQPCS